MPSIGKTILLFHMDVLISFRCVILLFERDYRVSNGCHSECLAIYIILGDLLTLQLLYHSVDEHRSSSIPGVFQASPLARFSQIAKLTLSELQ